MAAIPHGADADGNWIAACTAPDVCVVGGTPTPFDTSAILSNWDPSNPETFIRSRSYEFYREGDLIQSVLGNAGSGIPSGTSLGSGHVLIDPANPPTRVYGANQQFIVDGNSCRVNTDASGAGGVPGLIYTEFNDAIQPLKTANDYAGHAGTAGELLGTRTAYRLPNGQLTNLQGVRNLPILQQGGAVERIARPGMAGQVGILRGASKVMGPLGTGLSVADGVSDQLARDAARADLTAAERAGRATTRGALEGGGGWAGAWAGAWAGGAAGVWVAGWGAIPGAIGGAILGGWGGGKAGEYAADALLESPAIPPATRQPGTSIRW